MSICSKIFTYITMIDNNIASLVGVDLQNMETQRKIIQDPAYSVNPNSTEAFGAQLDDLGRLHWLIISRRVITILEFGLGKSTIIFNDALIKNQNNDQKFISEKLRKNNQYECHSVDNYQRWIDEVKKNNSLKSVSYHKSNLEMGTFNGRACTYYDPLPNLVPT